MAQPRPTSRPSCRNAARWANGAFVVIDVGTWKRGRPRRQAKNFATSSARPPPSPTTAPNSGSRRSAHRASRASIVVTSWTAGEMAVEVVLEPGPQVGHRHDDVGAVDEVRQLRDQLPAEDRDGSRARWSRDGSRRRSSCRTARTARDRSDRAAGRRSTAPPDPKARRPDEALLGRLTISLDVCAMIGTIVRGVKWRERRA